MFDHNTVWRIELCSHRSLELLARVGASPKYLTWWGYQIDTKRRLHSVRLLIGCNLAMIDYVNHLLLQCLALQDEQDMQFENLRSIPDGSGRSVEPHEWIEITIGSRRFM